MSGARLGILGGTFDPIHYAHLAIAEQAREQLDLREVLFVPAGTTVHKPPAAVSDAVHRARMVELAIADNPCFALSRIELERGGPSYTVDTLEQLSSARPGDELYFIVSAEAARQLATWRQPARILARARMAVVPRPGSETPSADWLASQTGAAADRFMFVDTPPLGHSSSDIRARVRAGTTIRYLVPPVVEDYIRQHRLYRGEP